MSGAVTWISSIWPKRQLAISLCGLLLLAGCSGKQEAKPTPAASNAEASAYEPYASPVTLRIPHQYSDIQLPEGETSESNFVTRYLNKQTGIVIKYAWEAPDDVQYAAKMDMAIRSGDLPDAFVVNRKEFRELAQGGMLEDLSSVYDKYASSLVRSLYDATGGKALQEASEEGELYGFPNVAIEADAPTYVWVRQDWLDRLGLEPPKTLADIARITRAFQAADLDGDGQANTEGIPVDRSMVFGEKTGNNGLNGIFAAYHAFPQKWIRNAEGEPVYGSVQPEAREALSLLSAWYKDGILDPKFMLRSDAQDLVTDNKTGLFFGPWWAPYFPISKSVSADTKAEWRVYAAPLDAKGQFVAATSPVTDRYLVVRKGYPHPEAVLKLLNVFTRLERNQDPNAKSLLAVTEKLGTQLRNYYPFDLLLDHPDSVVQRHDKLVEALAGDIDPAELDPETKRLYDDAMTERESPRKNLDAWSSSQAYLLGGEISKTDTRKVESLFFDPTPTMSKSWESLQKLETETYAKIITGELPIAAFDKFVETWNLEGGEQITKEVRTAIQAEQIR